MTTFGTDTGEMISSGTALTSLMSGFDASMARSALKFGVDALPQKPPGDADIAKLLNHMRSGLESQSKLMVEQMTRWSKTIVSAATVYEKAEHRPHQKASHK
jgi:hypothetical protein